MYCTVRHPNQKTSTVRRADQKGLPSESGPEALVMMNSQKRKPPEGRLSLMLRQLGRPF